MVHHVHEVECCQAQILQLGMVDDAWQKDWAQKPLSLRVEECANGATTEDDEEAAPAQVEADVGLCTAHLQAVYGHVMDQKEIAGAAEAWAAQEQKMKRLHDKNQRNAKTLGHPSFETWLANSG
jgi:hypothetical protein